MVYGAEPEEFWLELLDQRGRNHQGHEDGKQAGLHVDLGNSNVVECKGVEEPGDDVQHELADHLIWSAPVRDERAFHDGPDLGSEWHGVLAVVIGLGICRDISTVVDHLLDFDPALFMLSG